MRVHLRNVVESALERGVVKGHHRITKLPKKKQEDFEVVVTTMMKSIWESLDGIIDFTDDDDEPDAKAGSKERTGIGFHSVEAVSNEEVHPSEERHADDEDDEDIIPLDILYRLHNQ